MGGCLIGMIKMKFAKNLLSSSLLDKKEPYILLQFFDSTGEHFFFSGVNHLTGDRITCFDSEAPNVNTSIRQVKTILFNIVSKAAEIKIIEQKKFFKR